MASLDGRPRLPVLETAARPGIDRGRDRRLTFAGLVAAGGFLAASLASLLLPEGARLGWWLPLHLALAGGAGTAIAAMLPFFVAALRVAPPAPAVVHGAAIGLVALGAATAALGRASAAGVPDPVAAVGGALYVIGIATTALAAALPLRRAIGPRRPTTEFGYALALVNVAIGASLASLYLIGDPGILAAWPNLRVTHAWLNAFGFVGLVVAATLLHFAPAVAGARIRRRRSGDVAVGALAIGPWLVGSGYAGAGELMARLGAATTILGAAALALHAWRVHRDAAGWTTETAWHRLTAGSLLAAPAWLLVATGIAGLPVIAGGPEPTAWRLEPVAAPLAAGFAVQVLLGAIAHLVSAIGPGGPERHARARRILGRDATLRLAAWNVGVALVTLGLLNGQSGPIPGELVVLLLAAGAATLVTSVVTALVLLGLSLRDRG